MTVLVTGSNGFLGSAICRALLHSGELDVLALHRDGADLSLIPPGTPLVAGDFTNPGDMRALLARHRPTAIIHAAAVVSTGAPDLEKSLRINVEGTRSLLSAAQESGVQRWVQISSMSAHPGNKAVYGGTKFLADQEVRRSTLDWMILRPSLIYGEVRRGIFYRLAKILKTLPVVPLVGDGSEPVRPVHRHDLAKLCVDVLSAGDLGRRTYQVGGNEDWTFRQMILEMRRMIGRPPVTFPLPLPLCRVAAIAGEMLFEDPPLTSDNIEGLLRAQPCDPGPITQDFSFAPRSFQEGFGEALDKGLCG